jgi:hypothetical protein
MTVAELKEALSYLDDNLEIRIMVVDLGQNTFPISDTEYDDENQYYVIY